MGGASYELLVTLCTPDKPATKSFKEQVSIMKDHLRPKPSILAERYVYRQRKQKQEETVAEYVAELKKLSKGCEFGKWLEESLRDQLVCGLRSEVVRQRLFTEENLTFEKALALAIAIEAAEKNAAIVDGRNIARHSAMYGGGTVLHNVRGASETGHDVMRATRSVILVGCAWSGTATGGAGGGRSQRRHTVSTRRKAESRWFRTADTVQCLWRTACIIEMQI
ncbi:hypothetical protein O3G_MSEX000687 [Manduca sexta]|nr:hypothetical protein O3G_MSEX000687 [Manduca sexta]